MPGDVVKIEVYAKFLDLRKDEGIGAANLIRALLGATGFIITPIEGGAFHIREVSTNFSAIIGSPLDESNLPSAWLNCYVFDNDKNRVAGKSRSERVSSAAAITVTTINNSHEKISFEVKIEKPGYLYINVSHDAHENIDVYFDDLHIEHTYSPIVAGSDYYPFGLEMADRRITREPYRHGYQGQFSEKDDETGWNHFELREYDAVIGRWFQKDPYGQHWSPYLGMGNNPISGVDPDGGYTKAGAWWRSGFGLRGSIYQSGYTEDGSREVWGFNTTSGAHFGEDAGSFWKTGFENVKRSYEGFGKPKPKDWAGAHEGNAYDKKNNPFNPYSLNNDGEFVEGKLYSADGGVPPEVGKVLLKDAASILSNRIANGLKVHLNVGNSAGEYILNKAIQEPASRAIEYVPGKAIDELK
jgi:RHS repeat-associated protein